MVAIAVLIVSSVTIVGFLALYVFLYRRLTTLRTETELAFVEINQLLKQRLDELPKLIKSTEVYLHSEQATIQKIAESRDRYFRSEGFIEKAQAEILISEGIAELFIIAENHPDLLSNINFVQAEHRLSDVEEKLFEKRVAYNAAAQRFNARLDLFPDRIVANLLGFQKWEIYPTGNPPTPVAETDSRISA